MPLTTGQKIIFHGLVTDWLRDQQVTGSQFALYTLAFATNAQVKTVMLGYVTARKSTVQSAIAGLTAARAAEDAALAQQIVDLDAIITELG